MSKFLFCDIDGTLIENNKERNPVDMEVLKYWQYLEHKIVLCSNRNYQEWKNLCQCIKIPYDYLILSNGAQIFDKERKLYEKKIDYHVGVSILDYLTQYHNIWIFYYDGNHIYGYFNHKTYDHSYYGDIEIDLDFKEQYHQTKDFQMIWFYQDNHEMDNILFYLDDIRKQHQQIDFSINEHYIDIVPKECSKGNAIKKLLSFINEDIEKSYGIGDSYSDISLFENVDISASFSHSLYDVRRYTDSCVNYAYEFILKCLGE